eukprot:1149784-Pelagomonas_calceolata.AAC.1
MSVFTKPAPRGLLLSFDNCSSSNIVAFSFQTGDDMILAASEHVECAVYLTTAWERALRVSGSFEAKCMLLVIKGACAILVFADLLGLALFSYAESGAPPLHQVKGLEPGPGCPSFCAH